MAKQLTFPDGTRLSLDHPRIMGILNVTPDSFSDGGQWADPATAVGHGLTMVRQGADIIDIGGESTRPGSRRVPPDEQIVRTCEVIRQLRLALQQAGLSTPISIDTTHSQVARAALEAGANMLNDISAGREDPDLLDLAARAGVPVVLMHMQGEPATMQASPRYDNVTEQVRAFLLERAGAARQAGVAAEQIVLDPGIGFGKTSEHNLDLLRSLGTLAGAGHPVLLGTSRKRFMGAICTPSTGPDAGKPPTPAELVGATCATTALGVAAGVRLFRVHDVQANRQAADVAMAIIHDQPRPSGSV